MKKKHNTKLGNSIPSVNFNGFILMFSTKTPVEQCLACLV